MAELERVDLMTQHAVLTLPYPPSKNELTAVSVTLRKATTRTAFARAASNYARGTAPWRYVQSCMRNNVFPTKKGELYFADVASHALRYRRSNALQTAPFIGLLRLKVTAFAPLRKRKRDVHNLLEALLDAMQYAQIFQDDSQCVDVRVVWGDPSATPHVIVEIDRARSNDMLSDADPN